MKTKTITVYEFQDLKTEIQDKVREKLINEIVDSKLQDLQSLLYTETITEDDFYKELGCSKYYAETTAWFVPSCYYNKNKDSIEKEFNEVLKDLEFNKSGDIIKE